MDQVSLDVFAALSRDDVAAATANFSSTMNRALSTFDLRATWRQLVDAQGPLKESRVHRRIREGNLEIRELVLTFERGMAIGRVAVDPARSSIEGLFIRPTRPDDLVDAGPPATPEPAIPGVRTEEVVFGREPWRLPGTLTRPDREDAPVVVLIHGSGPQDRHQSMGPNAPFRDIAEDLARSGIASFRYDKRTLVHRQKMPAAQVTVDQEVIDDGVAAIEFVRKRPGIRPDGVFIAGHSLGAQLAPLIAERAGGVAGLILLAAPARPMVRAVVEQARFLGALPPDQLAALEQQAEKIISGKASSDEQFLGVPVNYFRDLMARDSFGAARRVARPILLLRGARDYQVIADEQSSWQRALTGTSVEAHTLPKLNHLFMSGEGPPSPKDYGQKGRVHRSVTVLASAFVKRVLALR